MDLIRFLFKGLIRDKSRSLFPLIIISVSVAVIVWMHALISGMFSEIIESNAKFDAGHVKIMTRAYAKQKQLLPNDLALTDASRWIGILNTNYPYMNWQPRIKFAGLLDVPDEKGETKAQGPVAGIALDIFSPNSLEVKNLMLRENIVKGRLPSQSQEVLLSDKFFTTLSLKLDQRVTLISSGMDGSMAIGNFKVVGTVNFGVATLDRGTLISDIKDIQQTLFMQDATSEIIGLEKQHSFDEKIAYHLRNDFNTKFEKADDKFSPTMITLREQGDLGNYLDLVVQMQSMFVIIFVLINALVLWNSGIRNGIRRYSEFGLRLAIGEDNSKVFISLLVEALMIGILGSIIGTIIGLLPALYFQEIGYNIGFITKNSASSLIAPNIIRAKISGITFWIGFIPGILATLIGSTMAGMAIFKRQTAQLFKELEV